MRPNKIKTKQVRKLKGLRRTSEKLLKNMQRQQNFNLLGDLLKSPSLNKNS